MIPVLMTYFLESEHMSVSINLPVISETSMIYRYGHFHSHFFSDLNLESLILKSEVACRYVVKTYLQIK